MRGRGRSGGLPSAWTRAESPRRHRIWGGLRAIRYLHARFDIFIRDAALRGPLSGRSVMDEETDLANFAIDYATKKGVSYAEARYEHQEQENFILKNGVLDALYVGQDRGVGVRVLVNGALGFAATNMRTKSDVRAIVDDAIKVAKASRRKTKITFAHEDAIEMNWSIPEQRKLADVSVEEKIAEIQSVDRDLMAL